MSATLTTIGQNKMAQALANDEPLNIHEIALGGAAVDPTGEETALTDELYRDVIAVQGTVEGSPNEAFFEVTVPEDGDDPTKDYGPWVAQQYGLFDDDGDLIAIGRWAAPLPKPAPGDEGRAMLIVVTIVVSDLDALNLSYTATANLPWATDAEAQNVNTTGRIMEVRQAYEVFDDRFIPQIVDGRAQSDVVDPGLPDENFFNLFPVPNSGVVGRYVQITGAVDVAFYPLSGAGPLTISFRLQTYSRERGIVVYYISGRFHDTGSLTSFRVYSTNPSAARPVRVHFDNADQPVFHIYLGALDDTHFEPSVFCTMQAVPSHRADTQTAVNLSSLQPRYEDTAFVGVEKTVVSVNDMDARRVVGRSIATREDFDLSSSAYQPIVLTGVVNDEEGAYSLVSGRFQPQRPGYYRVHGQMQITNGPSGMFAMRLELNNGSQFICGDSGFAHPTEFMPASASGTVYLNGSSDYVRLLLKRDEVDANSQRRINYAEFEAVWEGY